MTTHTCSTCRHRGPAVVHHDAPSPAGDLVQVATGYFVCVAMRPLGALRVGAGEPTVRGPSAGFEAGESAGVADRSGHGASLCVTADFGCNRWQPA